MSSKTNKDWYRAGLMRAHDVAIGCLPMFPCGPGSFKQKKAAMLRMGSIMGIVIKAIEAEIKKEGEL